MRWRGTRSGEYRQGFCRTPHPCLSTVHVRARVTGYYAPASPPPQHTCIVSTDRIRRNCLCRLASRAASRFFSSRFHSGTSSSSFPSVASLASVPVHRSGEPREVACVCGLRVGVRWSASRTDRRKEYHDRTAPPARNRSSCFRNSSAATGSGAVAAAAARRALIRGRRTRNPRTKDCGGCSGGSKHTQPPRDRGWAQRNNTTTWEREIYKERGVVWLVRAPRRRGVGGGGWGWGWGACRVVARGQRSIGPSKRSRKWLTTPAGKTSPIPHHPLQAQDLGSATNGAAAAGPWGLSGASAPGSPQPAFPGATTPSTHLRTCHT